jgi:ribosomal protein L7/L12
MAALPEEKASAITEALFAGQKIEAIKIYRESGGGGLKEAKEAMDRLEAELREECPEKFSASAKGGCGAVILIGGMLAALAGWGMA